MKKNKEGVVVNKFESIREASRKTNISRSNIASALNLINRTAGGFSWKTKNKNA